MIDSRIVMDCTILNEAGNWIFAGILKIEIVYLILNTYGKHYSLTKC